MTTLKKGESQILLDSKAGVLMKANPLSTLPDGLPTVGDEYVLVRKDPNSKPVDLSMGKERADIKDPNDSKMLPLVKAVGGSAPVMGRMPRGIKGRVSKFRTKLAYQGNATSSTANTSLAATYNIQPGASGEFTSFATVFDDVRVNAVDIYWLVGQNGVTAASTGAAAVCALTYTEAGNLTSVAQGLESDHHQLLNVTPPGGTATLTPGASAPQPVTASGFSHIRMIIPPGATYSNSHSNNVPGEWQALADTGDGCGYVSFYVEPLGAGGVATIRWFAILDCTFRQRQ